MDCSKPGFVSPLSPGVCSSSFRLNALCCQTNSSSVYVCVCVRKCCHFILLHVAVQFSQHYFCRNWWADFLNKCFLSLHWALFGECWNIIVSRGIFYWRAQTLQSWCPGSVVAPLRVGSYFPDQRWKWCGPHCEGSSFLKDSLVCLCNFGLAGSLLLHTWGFSDCGEWGLCFSCSR